MDNVVNLRQMQNDMRLMANIIDGMIERLDHPTPDIESDYRWHRQRGGLLRTHAEARCGNRMVKFEYVTEINDG